LKGDDSEEDDEASRESSEHSRSHDYEGVGGIEYFKKLEEEQFDIDPDEEGGEDDGSETEVATTNS